MDQNELRTSAAIDGLLGVLETVDNAHMTALDAQVEADRVLDEVGVHRRSLRMALASLGYDLGTPCEWDQDRHPTCLCTVEKQSEGGCRAPMPLPGDVACTWTEDDPACDCSDWRRTGVVASSIMGCKSICSCGQPAGPIS